MGDGDRSGVRMRGVRRTYAMPAGPVHALRGADLDAEPGEFLFVAGPSGSGKSTLLHVLGALERPDEGSVQVDGTELTTLGERARTAFRRDTLGFVFQSFNLIPNLTALENVMVPHLPRSGSARAALREGAERMLDEVGLADRADHRPNQLSGGECQRTAVARALAGSPSLVLADEPTGELDTDTGAQVLRLLRESSARRGVTVITVTHDLTHVGDDDRVVRMRDGVVRDEVRGRDLRAPLA